MSPSTSSTSPRQSTSLPCRRHGALVGRSKTCSETLTYLLRYAQGWKKSQHIHSHDVLHSTILLHTGSLAASSWRPCVQQDCTRYNRTKIGMLTYNANASMSYLSSVSVTALYRLLQQHAMARHGRLKLNAIPCSDADTA